MKLFIFKSVEINEALYKKLAELRSVVLMLKDLKDSWETFLNSDREEHKEIFKNIWRIWHIEIIITRGERNKDHVPTNTLDLPIIIDEKMVESILRCSE